MGRTLTGAYHPPGDVIAQRPLSVALGRAAGGPMGGVAGRIAAEGLATDRPLGGELRLRRSGGICIEYVLRFDGDDGTPYRLIGRQPLRVRTPWEMTRIRGELSRLGGQKVAEVELRVDWRALGARCSERGRRGGSAGCERWRGYSAASREGRAG